MCKSSSLSQNNNLDKTINNPSCSFGSGKQLQNDEEFCKNGFDKWKDVKSTTWNQRDDERWKDQRQRNFDNHRDKKLFNFSFNNSSTSSSISTIIRHTSIQVWLCFRSY
uniref:Candidate secreted effector n=1 Tax=Meloidogyne incognita TaxID=6306 RepID=A0A914KIT1_MELIC